MDLTEKHDRSCDHAHDDIPPTAVQDPLLEKITMKLSLPESYYALMDDSPLPEHMSPATIKRQTDESGRSAASIPPKSCEATPDRNDGHQSVAPTIPQESSEGSTRQSNADNALTDCLSPSKMKVEEDHEGKRGTASIPPTLSQATSCYATPRSNSGRQSLASTIPPESPKVSTRRLNADKAPAEYLSPPKTEEEKKEDHEGKRGTGSIPPTLSLEARCDTTPRGNSGRQSLPPTAQPESPKASTRRSDADNASAGHPSPSKIEEEEDVKGTRGTESIPPILSPATSCHATRRENSGRPSLSPPKSPAPSHGSSPARDGASVSPAKSISPTVRLTDDGTQIVPSQGDSPVQKTKCDDAVDRRHALFEHGITKDSQSSADKSSTAMHDVADTPCGDDPLPKTPIAASCAPKESAPPSDDDDASLSPTQACPPPREYSCTNASASYWTYTPTSPRMKRQLASPGSVNVPPKRLREDLFGSLYASDPLQTTQVKIELPAEREPTDRIHVGARQCINDEIGMDEAAAPLGSNKGEDSAFLHLARSTDACVKQANVNDDVSMPPAVDGEGRGSAFSDMPGRVDHDACAAQVSEDNDVLLSKRSDQDAFAAQVSVNDDVLMPPAVAVTPKRADHDACAAHVSGDDNALMQPTVADIPERKNHDACATQVSVDQDLLMPRAAMTKSEDSAFVDLPERVDEDAFATQVRMDEDAWMPPAVPEGGESVFPDVWEREDQDAFATQVSMDEDVLMPPPGFPSIPEEGLSTATNLRATRCEMMPPPRLPMKRAGGSVLSRNSPSVDSAGEPRASANDGAIVPVDLFQTQIPCFDDMSTGEAFPTDPFATQDAHGFDLNTAMCALPPPPQLSLALAAPRSDHLMPYNPPRSATTALVVRNHSDDIVLPAKRMYSRKKAIPAAPLVFLFTGNENHKDSQYQFKAMFKNVTVAEDWSDEVTHIIAQGPPLKRTVKVLCAISKGLPVLSIQYIQRCLRQRRLVSEENYHFEELTEARRRALRKPLLIDFRAVYIFPSVKNRMQWQQAVEAAGGTFRRSFPGTSALCDGVLLLGMPSDAAVLKRRKIRAQLFSFEMLREALVSQVLDFEKHELIF